MFFLLLVLVLFVLRVSEVVRIGDVLELKRVFDGELVIRRNFLFNIRIDGAIFLIIVVRNGNTVIV